MWIVHRLHLVLEEEEDRASALLPTVPLMTSPPPSIPEIDSKSQHSLEEHFTVRLQHHLVPTVFSSPLSTDRTYREVSSL